MQQPRPTHDKSLTTIRNHGSIRERVKIAPMGSCCFSIETLLMKNIVHDRGARGVACTSEQCSETLGVRPPAFEAGPVPSSKSSHLVKEEQFRIASTPDYAKPVIEIETAANPSLRDPATRAKLTFFVVQPPAAIAHQKPTRGRSNQFTERCYTVLQRHDFMRWRTRSWVSHFVLARTALPHESRWPGASPVMTTNRGND